MQRIVTMTLAICLALAACGGHSTRNNTAAPAAIDTADGVPGQPLELPLPAVPQTLREPADRADYIIEHFWDAMEFADTLRSHSDDFMEQNFSNFVSVFPYAREDARRRAVEGLMEAAKVDTAAYVKLADIAEKYLYDPNSPMLSEDVYILFLEHLSVSPLLGDYGTIRYRYQLEAARKNRPGMTAADFAYITPDGRSHMLRKTPVRGQLLVIFYDPECEHCKEIMAALRSETSLRAAVADGRLTVLAMCAEGDRRQWESTLTDMPAEWTAGYVVSDIVESQRYVLRAMPTLYLLDADKKVLMKDVPAAVVARMFDE